MSATDTIDRVMALLNELFPDDEFDLDTNLVDEGIVDSMAMIDLVTEFEEAFDVEFTPLDMTLENFATCRAIATTIDNNLV